MEILSDLLQNSEFSSQSVDRERNVILREMQEIEGQLDEATFDHLHATAYRGTSLGRTILGPARNIENITRDDIINYIDTHYTAPRMVIAGAGAINHAELVKYAEQYFSKIPSVPRNGREVYKEPALFTGSDIRIREDDMEMAHVAIGFPTAGWTDPDHFSLMLIQTMLGSGWDKESSAGNGKHSPSRLIRCLSEQGTATNLMTFNTQYSDTGLFGIYGVLHPTGQLEWISIVTDELTRFCYEVEEGQLIEAKNQLKLNLLAHLDGSRQTADDIGRQLLTYGRRIHPIEMMNRIDAVDVNSIKHTARRFLYDRDHALAAMGPIWELPDYNYIRRRSYWLTW